jgi:RNA-directed DNA polymerase
LEDKAINSGEYVMNTVQPMYEWRDIPWSKIERNVAKLQTRIYRASSRHDVRTVHRLQRLSREILVCKVPCSTQRVLQDNSGKKTAGIDGLKSLTFKARLILVASLSQYKGKPAPVRRIWIPKPGKKEKRPLGIPTIFDRAHQALIKLVLEPEWEARFEPNSYGFRPGRSPHDAVGYIYICIN